MPIDILFISNGHGEDLIASRIAQDLTDLSVAAFPLVGHGGAFEAIGIPVIGPRQAMPSGGFILRDATALRADMQAGLGRLAVDQLRFLTRMAPPRLIVAVGDMLPVAASLLVPSERVLVGCNKTDFYSTWGSSYLAAETALFKWAGVTVYPRDPLTHRRLLKLGVRSESLGNPMMDGLDPLWPGEAGVLGVLPGSRPEAFENLALILPCLEALGQKQPFEALLAAPRNLDPHGWEEIAHEAGWEIASEAFRKGSCILRRDHGFAEVLKRSRVVLGLAGTANEQAVGCGRPVVAFPGKGPQYNPLFAKLQAELLGPGITVTEADPQRVAAEILRAFGEDRQAAARIAGQERMGEPGAAQRIAHAIRQKLGEKPISGTLKKPFTFP
ncbi:hypothetical protein D3C87_1010740 [compost metagenome]